MNKEHDLFKDKNLLVISPRYPPLEGYPRNVFVKSTVDELKKYFRKIVVISTVPYIPKFLTKFMQPRRRHESQMQDYHYDNVWIYYTHDIISPFECSKRKWGDKAFKKSKKILSDINFEPDLIHAHFTWPSGYVAVKLGNELKIPVVITAHGYDVYDLPFRNEYWFNKIKYVLDSATHIITVSKSNERIMIEKLKISNKKISVIPNGYDGKLFYPMNRSEIRKRLNLPDDKKIIINVANLVPVKGHIYLLNALSEVIKHHRDVLLVIVGDGPEWKKLEKIVVNLGLTKYVYFAGSKPHHEIPLWMNAADIFVLPSLSEGNPTVMFEALGVGLPFVGTTVGGIPEIITSEGYGLLCPPKNLDCLAEKILEALEREWDREKIRKYARQFTWENIAREVMRVYEQVLKKK